jgi:HD-like signal output (HDOD) protein
LLGMGRAFDIMKGGHVEIGEWLLRSWGVPESICVITRHHHDLNYNEKYSHYVKILQITNYLLKCHQIGDGGFIEIPASTLESLGLTQETLDSCLAQALNLMQDLETLTSAITK